MAKYYLLKNICLFICITVHNFKRDISATHFQQSSTHLVFLGQKPGSTNDKNFTRAGFCVHSCQLIYAFLTNFYPYGFFPSQKPGDNNKNFTRTNVHVHSCQFDFSYFFTFIIFVFVNFFDCFQVVFSKIFCWLIWCYVGDSKIYYSCAKLNQNEEQIR